MEELVFIKAGFDVSAFCLTTFCECCSEAAGHLQWNMTVPPWSATEHFMWAQQTSALLHCRGETEKAEFRWMERGCAMEIWDGQLTPRLGKAVWKFSSGIWDVQIKSTGFHIWHRIYQITIQPNKEKKSTKTLQILLQKVCLYFYHFSNIPRVSKKLKWKVTHSL